MIGGKGLRGRLLRGSVGSVALKLFNRALTLLVSIAFARMLGPSGYGVYSFVLAVLALIMVPVRFGLPILVIRETASAVAEQKLATIGALWGWSARIVLSISGVILLVGFSVLWASHGWVDDSRLRAFTIGLPIILIIGFSELRAAALRGLHHVVLGQLPEMLVQPLLILAGVVVVIALSPGGGLSPDLAMAIYALATFGAFIVGAILLQRCRPSGIHRCKPSQAQTKGWISAIVPLAFLSGLQIINNNTDLAMLGLLGGDSQVGVYRVAMQGGFLVIFGTQALGQVFMPYFSSIRATGNVDQLRRLVKVGAYATTASSLFVAVLFWMFGRSIIVVVFGPEYVQAYLPLSILAAGQVFSASMGLVGPLLSMTGHERETLRGFVISFAVNLTLNILLIPYFGALGAATATSLSLVVLNVILWQSVRARLHINASVIGRLSRSP